MEEKVYNEQLGYYLACFKLESNHIPAIGDTRKAALAQSGIYNAADLSQLKFNKIPGIGPKNQQILLDWQRQVAQGFIYVPDSGKINEGLVQVEAEINQLKNNLETAIRKDFQAANYLKTHLENQRRHLEKQLREQELMVNTSRNEALHFRRLANEFIYV